VTWGPDSTGDMVIHVPLEKKAWAARLERFIPSPQKRHILLDEIGADVWSLCDGETSIDTIRQRIATKYRLNHKEAEASVLEFLKMLARRKLIVTIAGPEAPAEDAASETKPRSQPKKEKNGKPAKSGHRSVLPFPWNHALMINHSFGISLQHNLRLLSHCTRSHLCRLVSGLSSLRGSIRSKRDISLQASYCEHAYEITSVFGCIIL